MKHGFRQFVVVALAIVNLGPLLWLARTALVQADGRFTVLNFQRLSTDGRFWQWGINSVFLACVQTVCAVVFSSLGGFALAKYRFAGQKLLMAFMLAVMLLPSQVILGSLYELIDRLGWMDSYLAILVPGAVSIFGTFLFRQAMLAVPDELLQAARLDGCGELRLWWEIAVPLVRPMVGAFTLMSFLASWTAYLWPQIVLQDDGKYTLPLGLANMMGLQSTQNQYGLLAAGTMLGMAPVVALFFAVQNDFMAAADPRPASRAGGPAAATGSRDRRETRGG